jgi:hypothetical protein
MEPVAAPDEDEPMNTSTSTPTPRNPDSRPGSGRDAVNRERFALRRMMRESRVGERALERALVAFTADQEDAKRTIERYWRVEHWGMDLERPPAWRAGDAARPQPATESRIAWQLLRRGARVISSDGSRVGAVEHVLGDVRLDIFGGVVIDTRLGPGGMRFVDPTEIAAIHRDRIVLTVRATQVDSLPRPSRNPGALLHRATDPMPSTFRLTARRIRHSVAGRARLGKRRPLRARSSRDRGDLR